MKNIPILVDGPNYINRILDLNIDPCHIARQLSLESLRELVNQGFAEIGRISSQSESVEFICSTKRFGSGRRRFSYEQQDVLLDRLRGQPGVYVDIVDIPGSSEKGVDQTISGKIEDYATDVEAIVLVSADTDFIPTVKKMRHRVKTILVALSESYPSNLRNEGYYTMFLQNDYPSLFEYHYPRFFVGDLDKEKCSEMFSEADDGVHNQLRISHNGYVYISKQVGLENISNVKCRWETWAAYNGYVGPVAASDKDYVGRELRDIHKAWRRDASGYISMPIDQLFPEKKDG